MGGLGHLGHLCTLTHLVLLQVGAPSAPSWDSGVCEERSPWREAAVESTALR